MTQHTPGPWAISPIRDADGALYIESPLTDARNERVACIFGFAEADANARLIAAAPDMLAALREAYLTLECRDGTARVTEQVRAAIAKATGE